MYRASADCLAFVENIGVKLRNVVPRYQKEVCGDINSAELPQAESARVWMKTFSIINARFNGRIWTEKGSERNPKGRDLRITESEIGDLANLAQWLVNLHHITEARMTGERFAPQWLTINIEDLIVREKVYG